LSSHSFAGEPLGLRYLVACQVLALQPSLILYVAPSYFGVLARTLGFSNQDLARVGTAETLAPAIVMAGLSFVIGRMNLKALCLFALATTLLSLIASMFVTTITLLLPLRALIGSGLAVLTCAVAIYIAATRVPVRWFGWQLTLTTLVTMAGLAAMPAVEARWGLSGFYVALLLLSPATAWAVIVLPPRPLADRKAENEARSDHADGLPSPSATWRNPGAILGLVALAFYAAYIYPTYYFGDRTGAALGLSAQDSGFVLSATTPVGLAGSLLASWLGYRFGTVRPVAACALLAVVGALALAAFPGIIGFWIAFGTLSFIWNAAQPYLYDAIARHDTDGRFLVAIGPVENGTKALMLTGYATLMDSGSATLPILVSSVFMLLSAGATALSARASARTAAQAPA
jgi:hypothetical protein